MDVKSDMINLGWLLGDLEGLGRVGRILLNGFARVGVMKNKNSSTY